MESTQEIIYDPTPRLDGEECWLCGLSAGVHEPAAWMALHYGVGSERGDVSLRRIPVCQRHAGEANVVLLPTGATVSRVG